jgi:hypothetical protein
VATCAAALALPPSAAADPVPLGGSPLNVQVDGLGQLQAYRTDRSENPGIFFPPASTTGDAGLFLAFPGATPKVFGFHPIASFVNQFTDYTPVSQGAVTTSGTPTSLLTQVTTYKAGALAQVTQTTSYVNGAQQFTVRWDVKNISASPIHFKAFVPADFFFDGSDRGTGVYTVGPPQFIGGTNVDTGNSGGMEEVPGSEWSAYQALEWGDDPDQLWGTVNDGADSTAATLDDSVIGEFVDNAGAVEWDQYATGAGLAANAQRTFQVIMRSAVPAALIFAPANAASPQGVPVNFTATATDSVGHPYAGRTLRYTIEGANNSSGTVILGPAGTGVITDPGTNAGGDTLVAYVDFNNDETRQEVEPQASALASFVDSVPPTCSLKAKGDSAGGNGPGSVTVTVNCGEGAVVTVQITLTPPRPPGQGSTAAGRKKKVKRIKLRRVTHTVTAGKPFAFKLKLPKKVARRYAGKKVRVLTTVTAKDAAGNVKRLKKRSTIRVRRPRHRHR